MGENSKIEWTKHTANLWWGCTKVHAGCDNCYAETLSKRWNFDVWGNDAPRRMIQSVWKDLAKYQRLAAEAGEMHRVFVGSMMDIFEKPFILVDHNGKTVTDGVHDYPADTGQLRDQLFEEISAGKYPNLLFLLLTKRPSNINKMIPPAWLENPPSNVMFGTSPCNQETVKLVYQLMEVKGKRFLSVEPMLGEVNLGHILKVCKHWDAKGGNPDVYGKYHLKKQSLVLAGWEPPIHWIICGGESGHGKRPMNIDWARSLRDQCAVAGVPFFMKQIDKVQEIPEDLMIRQFPLL